MKKTILYIINAFIVLTNFLSKKTRLIPSAGQRAALTFCSFTKEAAVEKIICVKGAYTPLARAKHCKRQVGHWLTRAKNTVCRWRKPALARADDFIARKLS